MNLQNIAYQDIRVDFAAAQRAVNTDSTSLPNGERSCCYPLQPALELAWSGALKNQQLVSEQSVVEQKESVLRAPIGKDRGCVILHKPSMKYVV